MLIIEKNEGNLVSSAHRVAKFLLSVGLPHLILELSHISLCSRGNNFHFCGVNMSEMSEDCKSIQGIFSLHKKSKFCALLSSDSPEAVFMCPH